MQEILFEQSNNLPSLLRAFFLSTQYVVDEQTVSTGAGLVAVAVRFVPITSRSLQSFDTIGVLRVSGLSTSSCTLKLERDLRLLCITVDKP